MIGKRVFGRKSAILKSFIVFALFFGLIATGSVSVFQMSPMRADTEGNQYLQDIQKGIQVDSPDTMPRGARIEPSSYVDLSDAGPTSYRSICIPGNILAPPTRIKYSKAIYIDGNKDFHQQAKRKHWPGDGTQTNPYIIQDLNFKVTAGRKGIEAAVIIRNTVVWFVFQNNFLDGVDGSADGIILTNVANGIIHRNTISGHSDGIILEFCTNNWVEHNTIVNSLRFGIMIADSTHNAIVNNQITGSGDTAIFLANSSYNTITDNYVSGTPILTTTSFTLAASSTSHGIFLDPSEYNVVANNEIVDVLGNGVYLLDSDGNEVTGNSISGAGGSAIFLAGSDYTTITDNAISGITTTTSSSFTLAASSTSHGIFLDPSNFNHIANNTIQDVLGNGVYLFECHDNFVQENQIAGSGESGVFLVNSSYTTITDNTVSGTTTTTSSSFALAASSTSHGIFLDPSSSNYISGNVITDIGGNGLYLLDSDENTITQNSVNNAGESGIFLAGSDNNSITDNVVLGSGTTSTTSFTLAASSTSHGIFLDPSHHNYVSGNVITDVGGNGLYLLDSDDNVLTENTVNNAGESGIFLAEADYNSITDNTISGASTTTSSSFALAASSTSHGIFLDPSNHNYISGNVITDVGGNGMYLLDSDDNVLTENTVNNAGESGVFLAGSDYNTVTDNTVSGTSTTTSSSFALAASSTSHGIFLDPSNHNYISGNVITDVGGNGMYLLDSDDNVLTENTVNNAGESGVFLVGSDYNTVTDNTLSGASTTTSSSFTLAASSTSHGIFLDPSDHNVIFNNTVSGFTGNGLYLQYCYNNTALYNEIRDNGVSGIILENSNASDVAHNVVLNNNAHGVSINTDSESNTVSENDFIGNNIGGTSQLLDNASADANQFTNNYLIDHDNTDTNGDGTSDFDYAIDGSAGNYDSDPYALPVQPLDEMDLNLEDLVVEFKFESETLNLKSAGEWMNAHLILPEGYSVSNLNLSTIHIDGDIYIDESHPIGQRSLSIKFDKQALIAYLSEVVPYTPYDIFINITGIFNGDFLRFNGVDDLTVIQEEPYSPLDVPYSNQGGFDPATITLMSILIVVIPLRLRWN